MRLRIIAATVLLAIATPYAAGFLALGYGFNEQSRQGVFYHWLYDLPHLLARYTVPEHQTVWLIGSMLIYAVQYLLLFMLLAYAMSLVIRCARRVMPQWSEPTAHLMAWLATATALIAMLWLNAGLPLPLAALGAILAIWICSPSLTELGRAGHYANDGT